MKQYTVFWVGGDRDGEIIETFDDEYKAMKFAEKFSDEHDSEFHPTWGGVAISDEDGNLVEW